MADAFQGPGRLLRRCRRGREKNQEHEARGRQKVEKANTRHGPLRLSNKHDTPGKVSDAKLQDCLPRVAIFRRKTTVGLLPQQKHPPWGDQLVTEEVGVHGDSEPYLVEGRLNYLWALGG